MNTRAGFTPNVAIYFTPDPFTPSTLLFHECFAFCGSNIDSRRGPFLPFFPITFYEYSRVTFSAQRFSVERPRSRIAGIAFEVALQRNAKRRIPRKGKSVARLDGEASVRTRSLVTSITEAKERSSRKLMAHR